MQGGMKRNQLLPSFVVLAALFAACASAPSPASLAHDVYIKLAEPNNVAVHELTRDCRKLAQIPGVLHVVAGPRATNIKRDYNDEAFDVSVHLVFRNDAAFQGYLEHPIHKALLSEWAPKIAKLRVFDFRPGQ